LLSFSFLPGQVFFRRGNWLLWIFGHTITFYL
jgi:hypothetical protein